MPTRAPQHEAFPLFGGSRGAVVARLGCAVAVDVFPRGDRAGASAPAGASESAGARAGARASAGGNRAGAIAGCLSLNAPGVLSFGNLPT
jgi:hypothetical protein